jgi:nucleoside-diphosphate-sugar epimerase
MRFNRRNKDIMPYFKNTTIAIVGMGYIGKQLYQTLEEQAEDLNINIHCFNKQNIETIGQFEFDYIFNCAGNTGDFRNQIFETVEANIQLAIFLLKNAVVKKCLIPLSSTRIYGFAYHKDINFSETFVGFLHHSHNELDFIYDGSKKLMESIYTNAKVNYRISIPRLSNVFGKYHEGDLDNTTFLKAMLEAKIKGNTLTTEQDTDSLKDYIFIDDAIEGILRIALFGEDKECYNICLGKSYSLADWANYLHIDIKNASHNLALYSKVSNRKAKENLYFKPQFHLEKLQFSDIVMNG